MEAFHITLAALFGLLVGSFLNVCIYRIPRDLSVISPRSFCPECGRQIAWHRNIPLLSYAVLRGRCGDCAKPIAWRYPLVELATAVLFAVVAARYGWTIASVKWALFEAIAMVLFWTDMEERILPDEFTLGGTAIGLIFAFLVPLHGAILDQLFSAVQPVRRSLLNAALGAALLSGPMWGVGALYHLVRKREGLGLGDVKLLLFMGSFLGIENGIVAVMIGSLSGAILGIAYVWMTRQSAATYPLPFGSFLCLGAALVPVLNRL
jgi:leader peptidase (prepilin peptidase) / N-methyltransferase